MTVIKQQDFIQSIADGFQFIASYHPTDFIKAMGEAYDKEQSPAARNASGPPRVAPRAAMKAAKQTPPTIRPRLKIGAIEETPSSRPFRPLRTNVDAVRGRGGSSRCACPLFSHSVP